MIVVDPTLLTDLFINEMFKIDILNEYFEEDACKAVLDVYNCKVKLRMCKCNQICSSKFISCSKRKQTYHHECENVTNYYRNHPNNWCKKCEDRLSSESSSSPSPLNPRRAKVRFTPKFEL